MLQAFPRGTNRLIIAKKVSHSIHKNFSGQTSPHSEGVQSPCGVRKTAYDNIRSAHSAGHWFANLKHSPEQVAPDRPLCNCSQWKKNQTAQASMACPPLTTLWTGQPVHMSYKALHGTGTLNPHKSYSRGFPPNTVWAEKLFMLRCARSFQPVSFGPGPAWQPILNASAPGLSRLFYYLRETNTECAENSGTRM